MSPWCGNGSGASEWRAIRVPVPHIAKVSWAISVKFIAILVILLTQTNIAAAQTALQISGPVVATADGQIIENLQITADGQHGINVHPPGQADQTRPVWPAVIPQNRS